MKLSESKFDYLLDGSAPARVVDEDLVRDAAAKAAASYSPATPSRRRNVIIGSIVAGLVVTGATAAALPSIFDGFGKVDYQSSQEYTVDGRGPFRCEFGFRVDPPVDGVTLEPSAGDPSVTFAEVESFIQTHDWQFDDRPVALTTPSDLQAVHRDLSVMSNFISTSWRSELSAAYPNWMEVVGSASETGQCVDTADGSIP